MKTLKKTLQAVPLVMAMTAVASIAHAQVNTATVTGELTDSTGAIVPGATITLTNINTGIVEKTSSNDSGTYRIGGLIPGVYREEIQKEGFKSIIKTGIELHVEDAIALPFTMDVGAVSESVTVEAGAPMVDTVSTSLGENIVGRQVEDAPLSGRNPMDLIGLVPGVVPQGQTQGAAAVNQGGTKYNPAGAGNFQISGAIAGWNSTYVDGATVNVSGQNWQALVPTQDSVGEFRVDYSAVTPQYGRFAGGVVNFSTHSGTNKFHGTLYEYVRNTIFNANLFYNDRSGAAVPSLHFNQFGATIGGPILQNKAFFFGGWESLRIATKSTTNYRAPTAAEMAGNFSADGPTYDPKTGARAQCNGVIDTFCANELSQTAQVMYTAKPQPYFGPVATNPAKLALLQVQGYNGQVVSKQLNPSDQYVARVDYHLNDKNSLFGRYTFWDVHVPSPSPVASPAFPGGPTNASTNQAVLGDTYILSSTLTADFRVSYLRFLYFAQAGGTGNYDLTQFGPAWSQIENEIPFKAAPSLYPGSSWFGEPSPGVALVQKNDHDIYTGSAAFVKVLGHHSISFGGEFRRIEFYSANTTTPGANFYFGSTGTYTDPASGVKVTDNGIANFVEGLYVQSTGVSQIQVVNTPDAYNYYQGYYVTDTFQITPKLTANYGVRWELPGAWLERHDHNSVLLPNHTNPLGSFANPVTGQAQQLFGEVVAVNSPDYPNRHQTQVHMRLFEPRLGLNYSLNPNTVIRGGFGLEHPCLDCGSANLVPSSSSFNTATTPDYIAPGATYGDLDNPFPNGIQPPLGRSNQINLPYSQFAQTLIGSTISSQVPNLTATYVMQWNLNVEHSFGRHISSMVSYTGNRGLHLGTFDVNLNQLPDQYDALGSQLVKATANPFHGIASPTGKVGAATANYGQFLLPYPQFTQVIANGYPYGESSYNGLIGSLKERVGSSSVIASYTYAHIISNADSQNGYLETGSGQPNTGVGPQDYTNLRAERSNSAADVRQRLSVEYIQDLPLGHGKRFFSNANGLVDRLVSGYGVTGITQIQTGFPISLTTSAGDVLSSQFGAGTIRPNVVPGVNKKNGLSRFSRTLPGHAWFNTAAFAAPAANSYVFGNESRVDSELRADNLQNWDLGLTKATQLEGRFTLQLRAEYFNLFNRPQFGFSSNQLKAGAASGFGTVTSQANNPRTGQFSLRLNF